MPVVGPSVAEPRPSGPPSRATASADRDPSGRGWRDLLAGQAVYGGSRLGALASQLVPGGRIPGLAERLGRLGVIAGGDRRAMAARHQRRVRPELTDAEVDRAVQDVFASYVRYWVESFRLPGTSAADLDAGFSVDGYEHIEAGLAEGNGVILALPHLGGWEWAGFWLTEVKHVGVTVVVEAVEPPELADWFVGLRKELGMTVIPLGPSAAAEVARALKANEIVALLCDRDLAGNGIEVDFLGERTTLPGGPATLAARSGAPLLPAAVYFTDDAHQGIVRPPVDASRSGRLRDDVARITQDLAGELAWLIRQAPEQWHLLQPNWPSDALAEAAAVDHAGDDAGDGA